MRTVASGARILQRTPGLRELATAQASLCSREQLRRLGVGAGSVARQVRQGRWQEVGPLAVALHNGPLVVHESRRHHEQDVVERRLTAADLLAETLERVGRVRYLRLLQAAVADVAGGAQALSEIDVARLCRRAGLPEPVRRSVRLDARGRRRYLDVEWRLPSMAARLEPERVVAILRRHLLA